MLLAVGVVLQLLSVGAVGNEASQCAPSPPPETALHEDAVLIVRFNITMLTTSRDYVTGYPLEDTTIPPCPADCGRAFVADVLSRPAAHPAAVMKAAGRNAELH